MEQIYSFIEAHRSMIIVISHPNWKVRSPSPPRPGGHDSCWSSGQLSPKAEVKDRRRIAAYRPNC